jgi:hypothetical protein
LLFEECPDRVHTAFSEIRDIPGRIMEVHKDPFSNPADIPKISQGQIIPMFTARPFKSYRPLMIRIFYDSWHFSGYQIFGSKSQF